MKRLTRRQYYRNVLVALYITGVLITVGAPVINHMFYHIDLVDVISIYALIIESIIAGLLITIPIVKNKGFRRLIRRRSITDRVEQNLLSIGAYEKREDRAYYNVPKTKVSDTEVQVDLRNVRIRAIIERYLDSFSTALPSKYIVEDYFITKDQMKLVIRYEDIQSYRPEQYSLDEYKKIISKQGQMNLYFDRKHIVNICDYPHFLISGSSGSGKSYLTQQLLLQAVWKNWKVVVLDLKRSYGLFKAFIDYAYEPDDILDKMHSVEAEMTQRMSKLEAELDKNPRILAADIGYQPILVILEEYISLQATLDKKGKEELERIVKNLSVLARQSSIHLMIVLQSAGTENIQATTRSNLTKVLLGKAQSNILTATFGNGVDLPRVSSEMKKGEGLIQLDRITTLRVPIVDGIEDFHG